MARPESYTKYNDPWADSPSTSTPILAAALDHIEDGLETVVQEWQDHYNAVYADHALDDLSDVEITTPANQDLLYYDNASGKWKNGDAATAGVATYDHNHNTVYVALAGTNTMTGDLDLGGHYVTDYGDNTGTGTDLIIDGSKVVRKQSSGDHFKRDFAPLPIGTAWSAVRAGGWVFRYDRYAEGVADEGLEPGELLPLQAGIRATRVAAETGDDAGLFVMFDEKGRADSMIAGSMLGALVTVALDLRERLEAVS